MDLEKKDSKIITSSLDLEEYSPAIPLKKFIFYYISSFSFYTFYWAYKSWQMLNEESSLGIYPIPRAIFIKLMSGSLAKHTLDLAKREGYTRSYSSIAIFIAFFAISIIVNKAPFPYYHLWILGFLIFLPVVKAQNYYWEETQPELKMNNKFSVISVILVFIGLCLVIMSVLSDFLPENKEPEKINITDSE